MSPNQRGRATRDRILAAAGEVVTRDGFDATIEDVAAAAGVTRMTVYRHFASRGDLLTTLLLTESARIAERIDRIMADETRSPAERLVETVVIVVRAVRSAPHVAGLVTRSNPSIELPAADPEGRFLTAVWNFLLPYVTRLAEEASFRASPEETLDWLLRQVLLQLTTPGRFGADDARLRWELETFVVPGLLAPT